MKKFSFCHRCGVPWARHVPRCPGCGRQRQVAVRAALLVAAGVWLTVVLWL